MPGKMAQKRGEKRKFVGTGVFRLIWTGGGGACRIEITAAFGPKSMEPLSNREIRELKARAQRLRPLVTLGKEGLSDAFLQSLHDALSHHELVKVKLGEGKKEKKTIAPLLATKTSAHLIMRVGHVVVLFRRKPQPTSDAAANRTVQ